MSRCERTSPDGAGSREVGLMTEDDMEGQGARGRWLGCLWDLGFLARSLGRCYWPGRYNSTVGGPGRNLCLRGHQTGQGHQERDKLRSCVSKRERGQIGFGGGVMVESLEKTHKNAFPTPWDTVGGGRAVVVPAPEMRNGSPRGIHVKFGGDWKKGRLDTEIPGWMSA